MVVQCCLVLEGSLVHTTKTLLLKDSGLHFLLYTRFLSGSINEAELRGSHQNIRLSSRLSFPLSLIVCYTASCIKKIYHSQILSAIAKKHNPISEALLQSSMRLPLSFLLILSESTVRYYISQVTFQRPSRGNNLVRIHWHIACECEIMSIGLFSCALVYIGFV